MNCPPCNQDCDQGDTCPYRNAMNAPIVQRNGGERVDTDMPAVMFDGAYQWLRDLFLTAVAIAGSLSLGLLLLLAVVYVTGLHKHIF